MSMFGPAGAAPHRPSKAISANAVRGGRCIMLRYSLLGKGFGGGRVAGPLGVPVDGDDPPAGAVPEELGAIKPPRERGLAFRPPRLVGAEDVGDVAEGLGASGDLALKESGLLGTRIGELDEIFDFDHACRRA